MSERFNEASRALSDRLYKAVYKLPNELKAKVQEIRVRAEKPLALSVGNDTLFVDNKFTLSEITKILLWQVWRILLLHFRIFVAILFIAIKMRLKTAL